MGSIFPWEAGNRFELLVDGQVFFPAMLQAIEQAQQHVSLELYLVEDGKCSEVLVDALCAAAARGVKVRCLFDAFGSWRFGARQRVRLLECGVQLRFYNPIAWRRGWRNLYRDHRKIVVIDRQRAFIGGSGATDEFWTPGMDECLWHEVMTLVDGPLAVHWQMLFDEQWLATHGRFPWRMSEGPGLAYLPPSPRQGDGMGRVAYADARQRLDIVQSLLRNLANAKSCIWLATPYFLPSLKVRRALMKAARRGVDVRLLLTSRQTDNAPVRYAGQRYYPRLLRAGVRIFEYQPRFLHLKTVLVDDWVSVGSCNFDHWNLRFNLEANLETLDRAFTGQVRTFLEGDFAVSREITLADWKSRPLLKRFYQRIWGWADRLVVDVLYRRKR